MQTLVLGIYWYNNNKCTYMNVMISVFSFLMILVANIHIPNVPDTLPVPEQNKEPNMQMKYFEQSCCTRSWSVTALAGGI